MIKKKERKNRVFDGIQNDAGNVWLTVLLIIEQYKISNGTRGYLDAHHSGIMIVLEDATQTNYYIHDAWEYTLLLPCEPVYYKTCAVMRVYAEL